MTYDTFFYKQRLMNGLIKRFIPDQGGRVEFFLGFEYGILGRRMAAGHAYCIVLWVSIAFKTESHELQ